MFKFKQLKSILFWLSIIGKDDLTIIHNQKTQFSRIFFHAFRLIHLILLVSTLFSPFQDNNAVKSTNKLMSLYAVNYSSFNVVIVNTVDIIASWLHAKSILSIIVAIDESLDTLNTFTDLNVRIASFARDFRRKCLVASMIFLAETIVRLVFLSDTIKPYTYVIVTIAVLYKSIEICYITLYIDMQIFILVSLNENLNAAAIDCLNEDMIHAVPQSEEKIHLMHRTQTIYLNVWKMSENINIRFGGFLLSACASAVMIMIFSGTLSFDILMESNNKLTVLSE